MSLKDTLQKLKEHDRLKLAVVLSVSMFISIALAMFRIYYSSRITYFFLTWNLLLACIPLIVSTFIVLNYRKLNHLVLLPLVMLWLLFFPNAPYIVTDLFHLQPRHNVPVWYDLVLILFFSWNGLIIGFISLLDIQYVLNRVYNKFIGWIFSVSALVLGALGIYIGRFLRWNSWDVLTNPLRLLEDIAVRIANPLYHHSAWAITLLFSLFLLTAYATILQMVKMRTKEI